MRLLANENFPGMVVDALRTAGMDVVWVRTESPGVTDWPGHFSVIDDQRIRMRSLA